MVSLKQMIANRTAKQLRVAVLRPAAEKAAALLDRVRSMVGSKPTDEEWARVLSETAGDRLIFVGYMKANSSRLYDRNGFPTGGTVRDGDICQRIEEFDAALDVGGIVVERGATQ